MRLFYGLSLPDAIRQETARVAQKSESLILGRYSDISNHHITLAFLGEVPPEQLSGAEHILQKHAAAFPAPTLTLDTADYFGKPDNAILILRVKSEPALDALHDALIADCIQNGLSVDPGPFSPHITLARHAQTTPQTLAALAPKPLSFTPTCAHVFLSARDERDILRYTPLFSADFGSDYFDPM